MKIIICGPPHSGKSVFLGGLCENLPRHLRYLFRACPDGEGTWTWAGNGAEKYRRKGTFSQENVDWYCQSLASCNMAPIVLVDIGGIPSSENHQIGAHASHVLVLMPASMQSEKFAGLQRAYEACGLPIPQSLDEVKASWLQYAAELGLTMVADLVSDYHGAEDSIVSDPMVVHHLDRDDKSVSSRPAIQAVAEKLLKPKTEEILMSELNFAPLTIAAIANAIDKTEEDIPVRGGGTRKGLNWRGEDLPAIADLLHNLSASMPEIVEIDGAGPAWLMAAIAHECHPQAARLNSPDGFVLVHCQKPSGRGSGLDFAVKTGPDGWRVVEFALDPSKPLAPEDLNDITPPFVELSDKVVLSGRGPNWLMASLAMAYHGRCQACAAFQPGTGSTVCWTHTQKVALGDFIPGNV